MKEARGYESPVVMGYIQPDLEGKRPDTFRLFDHDVPGIFCLSLNKGELPLPNAYIQVEHIVKGQPRFGSLNGKIEERDRLLVTYMYGEASNTYEVLPGEMVKASGQDPIQHISEPVF